MPAAHLMGWFKERIEGFDWFPEGGCVEESRLAYIGLRDIDAEEGQMLRDSNVHVYTMRDVDKYGIARVIEMAMRGIDPNGRLPIHLSLDVDSVDPQFAPGTGTCARGGRREARRRPRSRGQGLPYGARRSGQQSVMPLSVLWIDVHVHAAET